MAEYLWWPVNHNGVRLTLKSCNIVQATQELDAYEAATGNVGRFERAGAIVRTTEDAARIALTRKNRQAAAMRAREAKRKKSENATPPPPPNKVNDHGKRQR